MPRSQRTCECGYRKHPTRAAGPRWTDETVDTLSRTWFGIALVLVLAGVAAWYLVG